MVESLTGEGSTVFIPKAGRWLVVDCPTAPLLEAFSSMAWMLTGDRATGGGWKVQCLDSWQYNCPNGVRARCQCIGAANG